MSSSFSLVSCIIISLDTIQECCHRRLVRLDRKPQNLPESVGRTSVGSYEANTKL